MKKDCKNCEICILLEERKDFVNKKSKITSKEIQELVKSQNLNKNHNNNNFDDSKCRKKCCDHHLTLVNQKTDYFDSSSDNEDFHSCETANNIHSFKRNSNRLTKQIVFVCLMHHILVLLFTILLDFLAKTPIQTHSSLPSKIVDHFSEHKLWQSFLFNLVILFIITILPCVRSTKPLNYIFFIIYSFSISLLYFDLSLFNSPNFTYYSLFNMILAQLLLIIFCLQSQFTLFSRPILPYAFVYAMLALFFVIYLASNFYYLSRFRIEALLSINLNELNLIEFLISIFVTFLFIFYEIFDLQLILTNKEKQSSTSFLQKEAKIDYFLLAFNLLTIDMFYFIVFINSIFLSFINISNK
jgi:hypothetical protein